MFLTLAASFFCFLFGGQSKGTVEVKENKSEIFLKLIQCE